MTGGHDFSRAEKLQILSGFSRGILVPTTMPLAGQKSDPIRCTHVTDICPPNPINKERRRARMTMPPLPQRAGVTMPPSPQREGMASAMPPTRQEDGALAPEAHNVETSTRLHFIRI